MPDGMNRDATPEAARTPVAELQTLARTNSACKQGGKNQEWQNKQIKPRTGPTHPHTQPRQKQTRWKSVRTKPRQADTTNQANSNDFPAPLPYKGKGTPSAKFSCCCLGIFWPPDSLWSSSGQMWSAPEVLLSCSTVSSLASALAWPPAFLQDADRLEGGGTVASDSPVRAQSQTEEVTPHSRWPT